MTTTQFEVQARLVQRRDGVRVRDDVRLATSVTLDHAVRTARGLAADGFTVWIFSVARSTGGPPSYRLVERLDPTGRPAASQPTSHPASTSEARRSQS